jgi:hypothetical protein
MSPSVLASAAMRRDDSGRTTVDILILWRGSPGWSFRRTGLGGAMGGGSPVRDGTVSFSVQEGGLQLTAHYDPAAQVATILGERVELKGANVVFVDRVDSADGPVIVGTSHGAAAKRHGGRSHVVVATRRNCSRISGAKHNCPSR